MWTAQKINGKFTQIDVPVQCRHPKEEELIPSPFCRGWINNACTSKLMDGSFMRVAKPSMAAHLKLNAIYYLCKQYLVSNVLKFCILLKIALYVIKVKKIHVGSGL